MGCRALGGEILLEGFYPRDTLLSLTSPGGAGSQDLRGQGSAACWHTPPDFRQWEGKHFRGRWLNTFTQKRRQPW